MRSQRQLGRNGARGENVFASHRPLPVVLGVHQGDKCVEHAFVGLLAAELVQGGGHGGGLAWGWRQMHYGRNAIGVGVGANPGWSGADVLLEADAYKAAQAGFR